MSGTQVYATVDGILKHRHEGASGWHSAHIAHKDESLHKRVKADKPEFREGMSEELKARYVEALAGKSFEYLWTPGREARRAERVAAGGPEFIHHGRKPQADEAVEAVKEAQAIAAEAFEAAKS